MEYTKLFIGSLELGLRSSDTRLYSESLVRGLDVTCVTSGFRRLLNEIFALPTCSSSSSVGPGG
jgi:hypothetical protein